MSLPDHVTVNITQTGVTLARQSFGIVAVAAYLGPTPPFTDLVRTYTSMAGVVADGILDSGNTKAAYAAFASAFSQKPCVEKVKLLRLTVAPTVLYTLDVTDATQGKVYSGEINGVTWSYTVLAAATTTTVATAIAALLTATVGIGGTASSSTAKITFTPTVTSQRVRFRSLSSGLVFTETTADSGIGAQLDTVAAVDNDFYGVALTSSGKAEILALATWLSSKVKISAHHSTDTAILDGASTTDVAAAAKVANYSRLGVLYTSDSFSFSGVAWMSRVLAADPGTINWKFKNLQGVVVDALTETQSSAAKTKNANVFTRDGGAPVTQEGVFADGYFMDLKHTLDWMTNEMTLRTFGTMAGADIITYTNAGVLQISNGGVKSTLATAAKRGCIAEDFVINLVDVDTLDPTVRATRIYDGLTWQARGTGSINKVRITGYVGT